MKSPDILKVTFGSIPDNEQDLALLNSIKFVKRPAFNLLWSPSTPPRNSRFQEAIAAQKKLLQESKNEVPEIPKASPLAAADLPEIPALNGKPEPIAPVLLAPTKTVPTNPITAEPTPPKPATVGPAPKKASTAESTPSKTTVVGPAPKKASTAESTPTKTTVVGSVPKKPIIAEPMHSKPTAAGLVPKKGSSVEAIPAKPATVGSVPKKDSAAESTPAKPITTESIPTEPNSAEIPEETKGESSKPLQNGTLDYTATEKTPLESSLPEATPIEEAVEVVQAAEPPKPAPAKTWASIIGNPTGSQKIIRPNQPEPPVVIAPPKNFSAKAKNISELFRDIHISMRSPLVEPRGITNNNLLCYAHSILQSLIHVPPFLNLIKLVTLASLSHPEKTPILHSVAEICKQFRTAAGKKTKNNREQEPIEPKLIIKLVQSLRPCFTTQLGVQEDAHEFFSALINGLSDEILGLMKEESLAVGSSFDSSKVPSVHIFQTEQPSTDSDEAEWVGVGANNNHFITRESKVISTPITSLFSGLYRNTLKVKGKAPSVSQDCSIDLQLEVEPDHIRTVQDALNHLLKAESLDKAGAADDFAPGTVSKHFSFETLPPVLVLHLKIVVFCKEIEGARKILKDISCPLILTFPAPKKFGSKGDSVIKYQLVAVVYHHGPEAMAGHYTCDVRRGDDSWIFCNDSEIEALDYKSIGTTEHTLDGTPYLLFYTRV